MKICGDEIMGTAQEIDALIMAVKMSGLWDELHAANHLCRFHSERDGMHMIGYMFTPATHPDRVLWQRLTFTARKMGAT